MYLVRSLSPDAVPIELSACLVLFATLFPGDRTRFGVAEIMAAPYSGFGRFEPPLDVRSLPIWDLSSNGEGCFV